MWRLQGPRGIALYQSLSLRASPAPRRLHRASHAPPRKAKLPQSAARPAYHSLADATDAAIWKPGPKCTA
eukprot:1472006-Alexandrium_andersonii.AAC.1